MKNHIRSVLVVITAFAAFAFAGCASNSKSAASAKEVNGSSGMVMIENR